MGSGGGGGGGDQTTTVRFADYIESKHQDFLNDVAAEVAAIKTDSPFSSFTNLSIEAAFFGTGYVLASFPSLYDMYGKFVAGLDIDALFDQILEDSINGTVINNLVSEEGIRLSDDINDNAIPQFTVGQRDVNAVMSSTFVVGKAMMETARTKAISRFSAELRYRMLPIAADRWKTHLGWNRDTVNLYAEILKLYILARVDTDNHNFEFAAKEKLWPFTVLEYMRLALGTLTGATNTKSDVEGASKASSALGGAMSGAAAGYMVGGPYGAVVGGVVGLAGGLLS